jgi:two-component SAPR family response regulator
MIIAKLVNNHPNLHLIGIFRMQLKREAACQHTVDLIFLDIEMPLISGFDFRWIKKPIKIVFITSKAEYAMKALIMMPLIILQNLLQ